MPRQTYDTYECAGRSYSITFRDHGRALQTVVIDDRRRVDTETRRQTIKLLRSLRFAAKP